MIKVPDRVDFYPFAMGVANQVARWSAIIRHHSCHVAVSKQFHTGFVSRLLPKSITILLASVMEVVLDLYGFRYCTHPNQRITVFGFCRLWLALSPARLCQLCSVRGCIRVHISCIDIIGGVRWCVSTDVGVNASADLFPDAFPGYIFTDTFAGVFPIGGGASG